MNEVATMDDMGLTIDTSVLIAVVLWEPDRERLIEIVAGHELYAPVSIRIEICNAFSRMFKRGRLSLAQALSALEEFEQAELKLHDLELRSVLTFAHAHSIYAYDAYVLAVAAATETPLLTMDRGQRHAARNAGIDVLEV